MERVPLFGAAIAAALSSTPLDGLVAAALALLLGGLGLLGADVVRGPLAEHEAAEDFAQGVTERHGAAGHE